MAFLLYTMATITFNVTFNYATDKLVFTDTSDWAGQGIDKQYLIGDFKVVTPDGNTYYENVTQAFITGTAQAGASTTLTLASGASAVDDYYKDYYLQLVSGTGGTNQYRRITAYNGTTKVATVESAWTVTPDNTTGYKMTLGDIFINTDLSNQKGITVPLTAQNLPFNGDYTIIYSVYNTNTAETYTDTKVFTLCYTSPTVIITHEVDCITPEFVSVDDTNYEVDSVTPSIVRSHTLIYPNALAPDDTGNVQTITTGVFYTGVQQTKLVSQLTYDYTGGVYVYDEVDGSKSTDVECDNRLCDIFCCVITLYNNMNKYKGKNDDLYKTYLEDFTQVMSLVALAREAWNCGKEDKLNSIVSDIRDIANCTEGCGCSDSDPQQVTGLGATLSLVEVVSGDAYMQVTSTTVGNTTIYTIKLDPTYASNWNSLYNTTVSTGTPTYLTITPSGTNPKNYQIDFTPSANWTNQDELCFKVLVDYTDYLGTFITVENTEIQPPSGSNFTSPTFASEVVPANAASFLNSIALFNVTGFMSSANDNFKVFLTSEIVSVKPGEIVITNPGLLSYMTGVLVPQLNYVQSGSFQIGVYSTIDTGALLNGYLKKLGLKFYIHVLVKK